MTTDERLLAAVKQAADQALRLEIIQLQRKLKKALTQRDDWKQKATHYRAKLLERGEMR